MESVLQRFLGVLDLPSGSGVFVGVVEEVFFVDFHPYAYEEFVHCYRFLQVLE